MLVEGIFNKYSGYFFCFRCFQPAVVGVFTEPQEAWQATRGFCLRSICSAKIRFIQNLEKMKISLIVCLLDEGIFNKYAAYSFCFKTKKPANQFAGFLSNSTILKLFFYVFFSFRRWFRYLLWRAHLLEWPQVSLRCKHLLHRLKHKYQKG